MAKEDDAKETENEAVEGGKKPRKKLIIILSLVVVLVAGIGGGVTWFFFPGVFGGDSDQAIAAQDGGPASGDKPRKPRKVGKDGTIREATYFSFDPPFIVNFRDQTHARFLQVEVQVMTTDPTVVDQIKKHMPRIRNDLILLFSSQSYDVLSTREGKEKMRDEALFEIRKVLKEETGDPGVDAIYFTALIMQ